MYSTIPNASFLFWRVFANTFTIEGQPIGFFKALVFFSWRRVIKRSCLYVSVSHYFTSVQCVSFIWTLAVIELNLILIITNAERSAHANSQLADLDCNAILRESSITINTVIIIMMIKPRNSRSIDSYGAWHRNGPWLINEEIFSTDQALPKRTNQIKCYIDRTTDLPSLTKKKITKSVKWLKYLNVLWLLIFSMDGIDKDLSC